MARHYGLSEAANDSLLWYWWFITILWRTKKNCFCESQFSIDKHFEWNLCKAFSNEKKKFHIFSSQLLIAIPNVTFEMYGTTLLKSLFNEQGKTNMYLILFSVAFFICEFSLKRNSIKKQQQKIKWTIYQMYELIMYQLHCNSPYFMEYSSVFFFIQMNVCGLR